MRLQTVSALHDPAGVAAHGNRSVRLRRRAAGAGESGGVEGRGSAGGVDQLTRLERRGVGRRASLPRLAARPPTPPPPRGQPGGHAHLSSAARRGAAAAPMSAAVVVVLPVYNEALRLEVLLERIERALTGKPFRIVAVDDGSRDDSTAILARRSADL